MSPPVTLYDYYNSAWYLHLLCVTFYRTVHTLIPQVARDML